MFAIGPVEDEADVGKEGEDEDSPAAAMKTPRTTSDYYESSSFNPPSNEDSQRFEDVLTFACPSKSSGESLGDRQFIVPIGNAGDILIDATADADEGNATTTSDKPLETVIISDRVRLVRYSNNEIYRVHASTHCIADNNMRTVDLSQLLDRLAVRNFLFFHLSPLKRPLAVLVHARACVYGRDSGANE